MNIGIIPARLDSKRFPKKILEPINGKPMIANTVERTLMSKKLERVILAIDSEETKHALRDFNFEIVMTSSEHQSGTDRIAEVACDFEDLDIIINIQGDEPLIDPKVIDSLVSKLEDPNVDFATVLSTNLTTSDFLDPNVVKAIINEKQEAIEFKRNIDDFEIGGVYRHVGLYGYTKKMLMRFTALAQSQNEIAQKLEQLRALDNNITIDVIIDSCNSLSVDTKEDFEKITKLVDSISEIELIEDGYEEQ
ncbi:MAG: 3-deoxy-manno-octulosonate cytidylyltransferase [Candidatus Marinimicrobia bacterium]|nr:3-deoxy-manno-octulosonate cytidylyltransferase [Candidatus Neomarinimicrobiota bacterium]|tara:strand:+ start:11963 stop:12712 length:750 start_codon:yes stop_codon:yes gene_type:complete